jgi:hypothetical protein
MKKLKLSLLILLSLAQACFAGVFSIDDFSGGLSNFNSYVIKPNQCVQADNVDFAESIGALSKRPSRTLYGTAGTAAVTAGRYGYALYGTDTYGFPVGVTGLYRAYFSDGTKRLLINYSTFLKYGNDVTGAFTTLRNGLTAGLRGQYLTYKDTVIFMNGTDNAQKWDGKVLTDGTDGSRTANLLTADLGAPFAELNTGTDLDANSWYQYKMAFYNGSTYDYSNARSNPIMTTGSVVTNIALTGIPIGPTGTTYRYVYRTVGYASQSTVESASNFYLVSTIANNTTLTVNDAVTDDTADDDAAPTWATVSAGSDATPPKGKYCTIHDEKLVISGNSSDQSDVYWSDEFNPDFFDIADYIEVRPDDGDSVTFLRSELGNLLIGKTNTIQKFFTDNNSVVDWYMSAPYSYIGCPAPYTAVNTPLGLIYLGRDGIYRFTGYKSELLSTPVQDEIDNIIGYNLTKCVAIFHDNKYMLAYPSASGAAATNDRVLIYDTITGAWSIDTMDISSYCIFNSGSDVGELYSGDSTATGNIYSHEQGTSETSISTVWQSGWTNLGVLAKRKLINRIRVFYTGTSGSLSCTYTNEEGDTADSFSIDLSVDPAASTTDLYTGVSPEKVYTFYPPANTETRPSPISDYWKFSFTEGAGSVWSVQKLEVRYEIVDDID